MTRVAVLGAGAVGCWFGGVAARAGHDVVLIARRAHVERIRSHGLRMESAAFDEIVEVEASEDPSALRGASIVLCCVKATGIDAAGADMAPHLDEGTIVLALQNGVDGADRLSALLAVPVLPVVVYVATEMAGAGHVRHHGRGELVVGDGPGARSVAELYAGSPVEVRISADVVGELWAKLVVNGALNAISALTHRPYGEMWGTPGVAPVVRGVVDECLAVAAAAGIEVPGDPWASVESIVASMPTQRSSTEQDLRLGRPTEIEHLNGHVARTGVDLGVPTPRNDLLRALVRLAEEPPGDRSPTGPVRSDR